MKQVLFVLALWFLADWAFYKKLKPFVATEFHLLPDKPVTADSTTDKYNDTTHYHEIKNASSYVYGIDVSHYEYNELDDLPSIIKQNDSLLFVICKATQGTNKKDSAFPRNWKLIKSVREKKIYRGAYHFFICGQSARSQADTFITVVDSLSETDLPPIIDFETAPKLNHKCSHVADSILAFLTRIEAHFKRKPIIYINNNDADNYLNDPIFSSYPLWLAKPGKRPNLRTRDIPDAWKGNWHFWQTSWNYTLDNINNDLDKFNGDSLALVSFIAKSKIE